MTEPSEFHDSAEFHEPMEFETVACYEAWRSIPTDGYLMIQPAKFYKVCCTISNKNDTVSSYISQAKFASESDAKKYPRDIRKSEPERVHLLRWIRSTWQPIWKTIDDTLPPI